MCEKAIRHCGTYTTWQAPGPPPEEPEAEAGVAGDSERTLLALGDEVPAAAVRGAGVGGASAAPARDSSASGGSSRRAPA